MIKVRSVPANYENFYDFNSTSAMNQNKLWKWVPDGEDITVYIDGAMVQMLDDPPGRKYGWLLESRTIIPGVFDWAEQNADALENACDGVFTCDVSLTSPPFLYSISNAVPWVQNRMLYDKTKLVSMISSNKSFAVGHRNRLALVNQFADSVDFFGRGFNYVEDKTDALKDYMFSIAIENCDYDCYFTEKLTDCFATGTIPVFYGTRGVDRYFNPNGIIFLDDAFSVDDLSADLYYDKIDAVKENLEIAKSIPTAEDYICREYLSWRG